MRLLFCQFGGLGEQAIATSFEQMGFEVENFFYKTKNYDYDKNYFQAFLDKMEKANVDIVFSINFLPIISKVCQAYRIIYISWIYDCPEMHLYSKAICNSVNRIFLFDRIQYEYFHKISPTNVFYMPLATKPLTEKDIHSITAEERRKYSHDICFIGSLYNDKDKRFHELKNLPDYLRGYIEGLVNAQLNVYGYNMIQDSLPDDIVSELKKHLKFALIDDYEMNDRAVFADMYIGDMVSALERERVIDRLQQSYKVTLYTGSDTSQYKNVDNKGLADSLTMMPKIFHCSKINLNITSKTIQSGIPLRVFDVLGCGGFLITNYQPELCEYFVPDEDLVVYESMEDLAVKVEYYLTHEEERKAIAQNGYEKVMNSFTYEIALKDMFNIIGIE